MNKEELKTNKVDIFTAAISAGASSIPVIGGVFAEIIKLTIPKQREDRIVKFISELSDKLDELEISVRELEKIFSNFQYGTFIFECIKDVVNEIYDEKIIYYKELCINGITGDEKNLINNYRILQLLSDIGYYELLYLQFYNYSNSIEKTKIKEIKEKLEISTLQPNYYLNMTEEQFNNETFKQITINNLLQKGLIEQKAGNIRRGGRVIYQTNITNLGKLLLKRIGV